MGRKHHTEEQIIGMLRAAEVVVSKGGTIDAFCRDQKITEATYYRCGSITCCDAGTLTTSKGGRYW